MIFIAQIATTAQTNTASVGWAVCTCGFVDLLHVQIMLFATCSSDEFIGYLAAIFYDSFINLLIKRKLG